MAYFRRRRLFRTRPRRSYSVYRRRRFLRFKAAPKKRGWFRGARRISRFNSRRMRLLRQIGTERMYNDARGDLTFTLLPILPGHVNEQTYATYLSFPQFDTSLQTTLGKSVISLYQSLRLDFRFSYSEGIRHFDFARVIIIRKKLLAPGELSNPLNDPTSPLYELSACMEHYKVGGTNNWKIEYDKVYRISSVIAFPLINLTFGKLRQIDFARTPSESNPLSIIKNKYFVVVYLEYDTSTPTAPSPARYDYRMQFSNIGGEVIS